MGFFEKKVHEMLFQALLLKKKIKTIFHILYTKFIKKLLGTYFRQAFPTTKNLVTPSLGLNARDQKRTRFDRPKQNKIV